MDIESSSHSLSKCRQLISEYDFVCKVLSNMMFYTHDRVFCIHNECIFHILCVLFYKINESI